MDYNKYLPHGLSILLILIGYLSRVTTSSDSSVMAQTVWNCTIETINSTLSHFTSNVQCRYKNEYDACLRRSLTESTTNEIQGYNQHCASPVTQDSQEGHCMDYFNKIHTWNCKVSTGSNTDPAEQYCRAVIDTAQCIGLHVVSYCGGLNLFTTYFTLYEIEAACKKALNLSQDSVSINNGGNVGTDWNDDDWMHLFSDDPFLNITPFPDIPGGGAHTSSPGSTKPNTTTSGSVKPSIGTTKSNTVSSGSVKPTKPIVAIGGSTRSNVVSGPGGTASTVTTSAGLVIGLVTSVFFFL